MTEDHSQHDQESKQRILRDVEKYGYHLALLEPTNYLPGFIYSIGFFKNFGHPEVICFGLKTEVMSTILHYAYDLVSKGEALSAKKLYGGFLEGYDIQFVEVNIAHYPNYVGYGGWFYDRTFNFPLLQLVWPDKQHKFPWEPDFNPDWKFQQPLLDRNTDFKFYEERNAGVYTTRQAFEGEPILYVYHNDDGAWQFHTSLEPKQEDAMLVCLEEITNLDPSINEIFHLEYGWQAWRASKDENWEYAEDTREEESNE